MLVVSWAIALSSKSDGQKQAELIAQSEAYMGDKIYVYAVPLLEEAAGYDAEHTFEAEAALKEAYLQMDDQSAYRSKYASLLEKQMGRKGAPPETFIEAANFYFDRSKLSEAYAVLKDGIAKTGDGRLIDLYESRRYAYDIGNGAYEDVSAIFGATIAVKINGLWGLANSDGRLFVPCEYDKVSTYDAGRAIVQKGGEIFAIDRSNNRLALLKETAFDFGNYAGGRVALLTDDGWKRSTGDFQIGSMAFEQIGAYSNGHAAAMQDGRWGVIDISSTWLIPAEHDGVVMDELGRSYAQDAAFVMDGGFARLFVGGSLAGGPYEDARPFGDEGYAAVKSGGKWGYIDVAGELAIDFKFDDALSFGQHLAAAKLGGRWGYINLKGDMVIGPEFLQAKSFAGGNAPVLTERGWQFISLAEYKKGAGLL